MKREWDLKIYRSLLIGFILLSLTVVSIRAQQKKYEGDPVTKYGLVNVLNGKQYQTRQIIQVINDQGVDFRLTSEIRRELTAAGARPELLLAIEKNYRFAKQTSENTGSKVTGSYENLIAEAMNKYNVEKDPEGAIEILERAVKLNSRDSRAYQLLGFVQLYGLKDYDRAEENMRQAMDLGGSAVFRVDHSHDVSFSFSCDGSLYVSKNDVRYESDNVEHTFDVPKSSIIRVKTLGGWGKLIRRKGGAFKISIRDRNEENDKDIYNFAPQTGKGKEAKLIIELIGK